MAIYKLFNSDSDVISNVKDTVSSGMWENGSGTLTAFYTSSVQSGSNGAYYMQVFNKDVSDASSQKQFSILYGHKGGSGSLGKPGTDGNRETAVVYGQMLNLTQPPETELFTFNSDVIYGIKEFSESLNFKGYTQSQKDTIDNIYDGFKLNKLYGKK